MHGDITELNKRGGIFHSCSNSVWIPPEDLVKSEIDKNVAIIMESRAKIELCESMKRYFDNELSSSNVSKSSQVAMKAAGILSGDLL